MLTSLCQNVATRLSICEKIEFGTMHECANLVDIQKCCKINLY